MLLSSCTSEPRDKQVLKDKPNYGEIIGTWKITKASVENIKRHVQSLPDDCYIKFIDDSNYVARNFPLVKHQEKEQIKDLDRVEPIDHGGVAKPHTAVYKMHRYFARRPYTVFNELIRHYSNPGNIILDTKR